MQGSIIVLDKFPEVPYKRITYIYEKNVSYKVTFRGRVLEDPSQFCIDVLDGNAATLLHVNPRWTEQRIVLNTYDKIKGWGREEYGDLKLKPFDIFEITIMDKGGFFWITVNNEVDVKFRKRYTPTDTVRMLLVAKVFRDDILLHSVQMEEFDD